MADRDPKRRPGCRGRQVLGRAGTTIAELLVVLTVSVIVIGGIYNLVIGQNRLYSKQRELTDVRGTLRSATEVLSVELRMASAGEGDIAAIGSQSLTLRSLQGAGIVCGMDTLPSQFGLYASSGDFDATADDSVMIYAFNGSGAGDDAWVLTTVSQVYGAGGGDVPNCEWGATTEAVLAVDTLDGAALAGVKAGAELRAFRRVTYGLYQADGRWWLGRSVGAGAFDKLAGPLKAPGDSGLAFYYFDATGVVTADPTQVKMLEILLRGESLKAARQAGGNLAAQEDSLRTRVMLRG